MDAIKELRDKVLNLRGSAWPGFKFRTRRARKGVGAQPVRETFKIILARGAHAYRCTWVITIPYHFYDRLDLQFHSKMLREVQNFYDLLPYLQPPQLY